MTLSDEAIQILKLRSVADKFALEWRLFEASDGILELQALDLCYFMDVVRLYGKNCAVFKLTDAGIAYCDANGIEQH